MASKVKALILGATGLIGHHCWRRWQERPGWEVAGTSHRLSLPGLEAINILDTESTSGFIRESKPSLIVLSASNPFVDYCEEHPKETRAVNVDATLRVAQAAREAGATLIFFSSDYIFDGKAAPYGEDDPVRPLNEYGRQKVGAERGIVGLGPDHLILRVSGVFGWELSRKNFVLQLADRVTAGQRMRAATDIRCNPTYAANLPDVIAELYEAGRRGVYHAAGAEELSRHDFALAVMRAFGLDLSSIDPIPASALNSLAPRPLHSSLRTDKTRSQVSAPLWGAPKALAHMKEEEPAWKRYVDGLRLVR